MLISLFYDINTNDFYEDMKDMREYFDTSDYPVDHVCHSNQNKKVIGKMKDEANGKIIKEYVGLRPKTYTYTVEDQIFKKAKGIKKYITENELTLDHYKNVLFNKVEINVQQNVLRSYQHNIFSETVNKKALSFSDDKRLWSADGISSVAYGHYKSQSTIPV